jgi:hypothetical protein
VSSLKGLTPQAATSRTAADAVSSVGAVIVLIGVLACAAILTAIGSAVRSLAAVLGELARLGSVLLKALMVIALVIAVLATLLLR